jgi:hypothetical protein
MGFMDKVKEQAAVATTMAKDAAQKGQGMVDDAQAKRAAETKLRRLGLLALRQRTQRAGADDEAEADALVEELVAFEAEHGELTD